MADYHNVFMTLSEEDYLKAIYHLAKVGQRPISTNEIAEQMDAKPSSVTDMLKKLLKDLAIGSTGICMAVNDSSPPFLKFLDKNKIALGDEITILDKEEFDDSFIIKINNSTIHISNQIASNPYLKIT